MSPFELNAWCSDGFGSHTVGSQPETRPMDVPWLDLDSDLARNTWGWELQIPIHKILDEIVRHAPLTPNWFKHYS